MFRTLAKVHRVVRSCKTSDQLETACNMLSLYVEYYNAEEHEIQEVVNEINELGEELWERENKINTPGF